MNQLSNFDRARVVACLVEGNSIRSTVRLTGVAKNTIVKLLRELGDVCVRYHDKHLRNLRCERVQCDEIWAFVGCKQKNKEDDEDDGRGDVWTWTAIDTKTKLMVAWHVGNRDLVAAQFFMHDLASRMSHRIQLTTDGFHPYIAAVEDAFGSEIDYAQLVKIYGFMKTGREVRYSRSAYQGAREVRIKGKPNPKHISTSLVERQNLTMRMSMRRFTRLTNAFSKKVENLKHSVALHFMHYNFCRIHQSLRITPAMEAGVSEHVWSLEELVGLLDSN